MGVMAEKRWKSRRTSSDEIQASGWRRYVHIPDLIGDRGLLRDGAELPGHHQRVLQLKVLAAELDGLLLWFEKAPRRREPATRHVG
jgi:hypothetical protein